MHEIVIIRDDLHPLLEKIEERILQLKHKVVILYWKDIIDYDFSNVKVIFMDRMGELFPTYETQIYYINAIAKQKGIKIVNTPEKYVIARNKILTMIYLEHAGIRIPKTSIITKKEQIGRMGCNKLVCKPYLGACAEGVIPFYAANIPVGVEDMLARDGMIIVQEFINNPLKFIWRVDIVNGNIIQLNQRYSFNNSSEFPICNGTHGGEINVWKPENIPAELEQFVKHIYEIMGLNVLGIDILIDENNNFYLLEVNPEPDITCDFIEFPYKIAEYLISECEERI